MSSLSDMLVDIPTGVDDQYPFDLIRIGYDSKGNAIVYLDNDPMPMLNEIEEV